MADPASATGEFDGPGAAQRSRPGPLQRSAAILAVAFLVAGGPAAAGQLDSLAAEWAARDTRTLVRAAPRLADGALAPAFDAMERRVGAYADWVYGWLSSLLTAWDLTAVGAVEIQQEVSEGRLPDATAMYGRLSSVVQDRFEATVVLPELTDERIALGWARAMARTAALDRRLAADRAARIEGTAARLGMDPGPALKRYGKPLLAASVTTVALPPGVSLGALSRVEGDAGGTADRVLVRSLRPLATRSVSVTTRLLLAPVVGGIVASPVAGANGLFAAAATLVTVSVGIWGVDYAVNRLDSALTRDEFETSLRFLLRDAHVQTSRVVRRHAEAAVCAALTGAVACDDLVEVAATPGGG